MSLNPKESNGRNIKCDLWKHFPPRRDSEPHVPTHMQNVVFVRPMRTAKRSDSLWWCHKKTTRNKRVAFFMSLNPKESNGRNIKCDLWKHFPPRRDSEPHVPTHMQNVVFVRPMRTAKRSDSLWWCHKKTTRNKT